MGRPCRDTVSTSCKAQPSREAASEKEDGAGTAGSASGNRDLAGQRHADAVEKRVPRGRARRLSCRAGRAPRAWRCRGNRPRQDLAGDQGFGKCRMHSAPPNTKSALAMCLLAVSPSPATAVLADANDGEPFFGICRGAVCCRDVAAPLRFISWLWWRTPSPQRRTLGGARSATLVRPKRWCRHLPYPCAGERTGVGVRDGRYGEGVVCAVLGRCA